MNSDFTPAGWKLILVGLAAGLVGGGLGIGGGIVLIPSDVAVTGTASVDIGRVAGLGNESAGFGSPNIVFDLNGPNGSVYLDLHVDIGNIDVRVRG